MKACHSLNFLLSQCSPVYDFTTCFCDIYFNIIIQTGLFMFSSYQKLCKHFLFSVFVLVCLKWTVLTMVRSTNREASLFPKPKSIHLNCVVSGCDGGRPPCPWWPSTRSGVPGNRWLHGSELLSWRAAACLGLNVGRSTCCCEQEETVSDMFWISLRPEGSECP
jgi:hypothetical protein